MGVRPLARPKRTRINATGYDFNRSVRETVDTLDELRKTAPLAAQEILSRLEAKSPDAARKVRHGLAERAGVREHAAHEQAEWRFDARALWVEFKAMLIDARDDFRCLFWR